MNHTTLVIGSIIISSALLSGCSRNAKIDQLSGDLQTLNVKVDQLSSDINTTRSDLLSTKEEAARANQRLDNQVHSYRK